MPCASNAVTLLILHTSCLQLARKISPSMVIGPMHAPHVLAPLVAMAQVRSCDSSSGSWHGWWHLLAGPVDLVSNLIRVTGMQL